MSEDQKIWFIYLTDHHEGPFTAAEVSEKIAAGLITSASLGWKDGMAEWVPLETIPELASALSSNTHAAPALADSSPALDPEPLLAAGDGEVSLAQMLAASQQGGASSPALEVKTSTTLAPLSPSALKASSGSEPSDEEVVWVFLNGTVASGLFSMDQLKAMAKAGDFTEKSMLWHPGMDNFQTLASYPILAQLRKNAPKKNPNSTGIGTGAMKHKNIGIVAAPNADHDDEPTDAGIVKPVGKFSGFMAKLRALVPKKKAPKTATLASTKPMAVKKKSSGGLPKIALVLVAVLVLVGGAGAAYFFLFSSPIPSDLDVKPEDMAAMKSLVKLPIAQGGKLYWAKQTGSEDNALDESSPYYYVATNLPVGTTISLAMHGSPGTLVNALRIDKTFTAIVTKQHFATFDKIKNDNGRPLPMGEYTLTMTADGAEKLETKVFFGGKKGPGYENRLHQYMDKLQASYDEELGFLREELNTLKNMQGDMSKKLADYKAGGDKPANKARYNADWRTFSQSLQTMLPQLAQKTKEHAEAPGDRYHPSLFTDLSMAINQMQQLSAAVTGRLQGTPPPGPSQDELEGILTATLLSLERSIAEAVTKSPMETLTQGSTATTTPPATSAAPTAPAPAPAAAGEKKAP